MDKIITSISPTPPFDFDLTAGYHTYFRGHYGTDSLEQGIYRRLLDLGPGRHQVLASVRSVGTVEGPELAVELEGPGLTAQDAEQATAQVAWLLGTDQALLPFYTLAQGDSVMEQITRRFYGLHLPHTASVFESLVLAILGQQIATNVARIVRTLLIETYGSCLSLDGQTYYTFPTPQVLGMASVEELRQLKLSYRKAEYVQGIALAALNGTGGLETMEGLTDEEVVARVTALRGVGHWTAQWVLIRALGRPDAFPLGDLALKRAVSRLYFEGAALSDSELEEFSRRWSPYRTFATVYLFTALRGGMA